MTGVWMELCPACDARRPAARAFIQWHHGPDRVPNALPKLFEDWETETTHAHGWARAAARSTTQPTGPSAPGIAGERLSPLRENQPRLSDRV
jgi:hypothetical protein